VKRSLAALTLVLALASCSGAQEPDGPTATPSAANTASPSPAAASSEVSLQEFPVPPGARPHDVAPAADGGVWYTAQGSGELGFLDPASGQTEHIDLGDRSAPHGVIVGPDGAPWITDGGLNAILRVDPSTKQVRRMPVSGSSNLNTATFDGEGTLWFTGQSGIYGRADPESGETEVFPAPKGRGPYGMTTTPDGSPWFSSLAGSYIARIDAGTGQVGVFDVPTEGGGARRVWSDSTGKLWVTEWFAGKLARFDPATEQWAEWALPGEDPQPYAVFVDDRDIVWVSDFGANALVRFDPATEQFRQFPHDSPNANVRQILGRPGEVWGAESGASRLVVARTG
jgi:virginiamycin B lyase